MLGLPYTIESRAFKVVFLHASNEASADNVSGGFNIQQNDIQIYERRAEQHQHLSMFQYYRDVPARNAAKRVVRFQPTPKMPTAPVDTWNVVCSTDDSVLEWMRFHITCHMPFRNMTADIACKSADEIFNIYNNVLPSMQPADVHDVTGLNTIESRALERMQRRDEMVMRGELSPSVDRPQPSTSEQPVQEDTTIDRDDADDVEEEVEDWMTAQNATVNQDDVVDLPISQESDIDSNDLEYVIENHNAWYDHETAMHACNAPVVNNVTANFNVDIINLTAEQRFYYDVIVNNNNTLKQFESTTPQPQQRPMFHAILTGSGGGGKSYLLKAVKNTLGVQCKIAATTGCAGFALNAPTVHSMLHAHIGSKPGAVSANVRRALEGEFDGVTTIIIEEYSMMSLSLLELIDSRLRSAFPLCCNQHFGGRNVILVGDPGQLPPVSGQPPRGRNHRNRNKYKSNGQNLFQLFDFVMELRQSQRLIQSSATVQAFQLALRDLRMLSPTQETFDTLSTRMECNLDEASKMLFTDAIEIHATNNTAHAANKTTITTILLNRPFEFNNVANIVAKDTGATQGATVASILPKVIRLFVGALVMLRKNVNVSSGLVNGARGKVVAIIYSENKAPPSLPRAVIVQFEHYGGVSCHPTLNNCAAITPVKENLYKRTGRMRNRDARGGGGGPTPSRQMLPLVPTYAITIHKAQGQTLHPLVVQLGDVEFSSSLTYTAISRATSLEGLLLRDFTRERLFQLAGRSEQPQLKVKGGSREVRNNKRNLLLELHRLKDMTIQIRRKHQFLNDIDVFEDDLEFIEARLEEMQLDDGARGQRRYPSHQPANRISNTSAATRASTRPRNQHNK
jgi:hypothetical protein